MKEKIDYLKRNNEILGSLIGLALIAIGTLWFFDSMFGMLGWLGLFVFLLIGSIPQVWKEDMKIGDFFKIVVNLRFIGILSSATLSEYIESFFKPGWPNSGDLFCAFLASFLIETSIRCYEDYKTKSDGYKQKIGNAIFCWFIYILASLYLSGVRLDKLNLPA